MNKTEFVDILRRHISSVNDYAFVNDTAQYYQNYIETAIRQGRSEEEVMEELGDPRLIAKSILASRGVNSTSETVEEDSASSDANKVHISTRSGKQFMLPTWLVKVGLIAGTIAVVVLVGALAIKLLPVICVGILAVLIYRFFKDNF